MKDTKCINMRWELEFPSGRKESNRDASLSSATPTTHLSFLASFFLGKSIPARGRASSTELRNRGRSAPEEAAL